MAPSLTTDTAWLSHIRGRRIRLYLIQLCIQFEPSFDLFMLQTVARYRSLDIEDKECHPGGCWDVSVSGIFNKGLHSATEISETIRKHNQCYCFCIIVSKLSFLWRSPVIFLWPESRKKRRREKLALAQQLSQEVTQQLHSYVCLCWLDSLEKLSCF